MTAHWGIPDPAEATGTEAEVRFAFADTLRMLTNRINIFIAPADPLARISSPFRSNWKRSARQERAQHLGNGRRMKEQIVRSLPTASRRRARNRDPRCNCGRLRHHGRTPRQRKSGRRASRQYYPDRRHPHRAHHDLCAGIGSPFQPGVTLVFAFRERVWGHVIPNRRPVPRRYRRHHPCPPDVSAGARRDRNDRQERPVAMAGGSRRHVLSVLTILGGVRYAPQSIPWLVGLVITAAYWFTSSTSFANPAVTLARGFTTTFAGIDMSHVPAFIIAQLVGAAIGAVVASLIFDAPRSRSRQRECRGRLHTWRSRSSPEFRADTLPPRPPRAVSARSAIPSQAPPGAP